MKINTKATHVSLTEEISDYLQKKLETLDKLIGTTDAVLCDVELAKTTHHKSGDIFKTEINLRVDGKYFRAVAEKDTLFAAIDDSKDEMVRELTSHKAKKTALLRRGGAKIKAMLRGLKW